VSLNIMANPPLFGNTYRFIPSHDNRIDILLS